MNLSENPIVRDFRPIVDATIEFKRMQGFVCGGVRR